MMHQSIATIDSPEFINLQPLEINPLMSSCEIKVLYLGENRNGSFITKEVATEMAKTLRGAPIVGYFKEEKEDFRDHGEKVIMDDEGLKFECMTKPYGFVAPDAKVWFKKFEDTDDFGNNIEREYLMTTGYLWTGQYEEAKLAIDEGRPQSMELDEETLKGNWSTNNKTGMDFFIINDAIFSKLCILGEDVEPCFEGASITAPETSLSFSKVDNNFRKTLYTMMQDLKSALEGGNKMATINVGTDHENDQYTEDSTAIVSDNAEQVEETIVEDEGQEENNNDSIETPVVETQEENLDNQENGESTESEEPIVEEDNSEAEVEEENTVENQPEEAVEEEHADEVENNQSEEVAEEVENYSKVKEELETLKAKYAALDEDYQKLVAFKNQVEDEKKDALINSFYMLSDEDKKEVIENKANYSLNDIEAKLSIICVRKKVNFDLDNSSKNDNKVEEENVMTYNVKDNEITSAPAWITALKNTRDKKNN